MPLKTYSGSEAERAAPSAPRSDVVASPKRCPVCGGAMPGRKTSACSDKCRAALSRRMRAEKQTERHRRMRAYLEAAVRILGGSA